MDVQGLPEHRGAVSAAMFPEQDRLNTWQELFGRQFLRLDVDPLDDQPFHYEIKYLALPSLNLSSGRISAVKSARTRDLIDDGNDDLVMLIPQSGKLELHERGRDVLIQKGEALVRRSCEVAHTLTTRGEYLTLTLPLQSVSPLAGGIANVGFSVVESGHPTLDLLKRYAGMLLSDFPSPQGDDALAGYTSELISRHMAEIVGLLIGAANDPENATRESRGGMFAARAAAIHALVERNALNPEFSVHDVARTLNISPGYIRKILASREQRFSDLLRAKRLDVAHRMLSAPHLRQKEVTQIALESGFSDISYFNRCFRQRFGMTPSTVRHAAISRLNRG